MTTVTDPREQRIAILYQALSPPVINGLRKESKPGGYSDSGADIGFALRRARYTVVTPVADPDPAIAFDWVFPDTTEGIAAALAAGATLLWANTVLFSGHPLEAASSRAWIVGPEPSAMQAADDKLATNTLLRAAGLPVAMSLLAAREGNSGIASLDTIEEALLAAGLDTPLVVKPVRGRGSQGVSVARDKSALVRQGKALIDSGRFGSVVMIEEFLPGVEITVPVMPAGKNGDDPRALPPVRRFDQFDDVAPYNGDVPVSANSVAMTPGERAEPAIVAAIRDCEQAARILATRAPIRIDCRADAQGRFLIFDVNLKPNLTGAGRPGREAEDSLSTLAAKAIGWSYADLLLATLRSAWTRMEPSR